MHFSLQAHAILFPLAGQFAALQSPNTLPILLASAALLLLCAGAALLCIGVIGRLRACRRAREQSAQEASNQQESSSALSLASPLVGRIIPLSEVKDPAISTGLIGQGCAILPEEGKLYAPFDGTVTTVAVGRQAMTIDSKDGIELFIQVGLGTARLDGKHFEPYCQAGDEVKKGDLLLSFDPDAIRKEGYDLTTPLLVVNSDQFEEICLTRERKISPGDRLLSCTKRRGLPSAR